MCAPAYIVFDTERAPCLFRSKALTPQTTKSGENTQLLGGVVLLVAMTEESRALETAIFNIRLPGWALVRVCGEGQHRRAFPDPHVVSDNLAKQKGGGKRHTEMMLRDEKWTRSMVWNDVAMNARGAKEQVLNTSTS